MPRVIAGSKRSLILKAPEGLDTRPTTDRIKETLFNILQGDIPGSVVADFFAGSGSIGIEALSRGAKKAYFVDNSKEAIACIQDNVKHTHFEDESIILNHDAISASYYINDRHVDIVFMDPPYEKGLEKELLLALRDKPFIDKETLFVIEADLNTDFSYADDCGYEITREKLYKTNKHIFLRLKEKA